MKMLRQINGGAPVPNSTDTQAKTRLAAWQAKHKECLTSKRKSRVLGLRSAPGWRTRGVSFQVCGRVAGWKKGASPHSKTSITPDTKQLLGWSPHYDRFKKAGYLQRTSRKRRPHRPWNSTTLLERVWLARLLSLWPSVSGFFPGQGINSHQPIWPSKEPISHLWGPTQVSEEIRMSLDRNHEQTSRSYHVCEWNETGMKHEVSWTFQFSVKRSQHLAKVLEKSAFSAIEEANSSAFSKQATHGTLSTLQHLVLPKTSGNESIRKHWFFMVYDAAGIHSPTNAPIRNSLWIFKGSCHHLLLCLRSLRYAQDLNDTSSAWFTLGLCGRWPPGKP